MWKTLSMEWNSKPKLQRLKEYKDETLAAFYHGFYELAKGQPAFRNSNLSKLRKRLFGVRRYKNRIQIAEKAWTTPIAGNFNEFETLRRKAFDSGWESLDSKCCLDLIRSQIDALKSSGAADKISAKKIDELQGVCNQAKRIAKVAGTTRRYIGALLYSALWMPDRTEAQAAARAAVELCMQHGEPMVEHKLWEGVLWIWYIVNERDPEAVHEIDSSANIAKLKGSQGPFWDNYLSPFYPV